MITVDEAQELVRKHGRVGSVVSSKLEDALGLVLAQAISAKAPLPLFDTSSVDGYAVSLDSFSALPESGAVELTIAGEIQPGDPATKKLHGDTTYRIFTGAPVPAGADAVVMQEHARREINSAIFSAPPKRGANIRRKGGEHERGANLFLEGTLLTPPIIGALAALGYASVKVYARPRVALVITGNELRAPGTRLKGSEIWDANSYALSAMLGAMGVGGIKIFQTRDSLKEVTRALGKALEVADLVIASGGVSVGDHDHVRPALAELKVREIFWRVRMRPGMPLYYGKKGSGQRAKFVFALPGNPVSAGVTFQLFVRRAIFQLMGRDAETGVIEAKLTHPIKKSHERREFVRAVGREEGGRAVVTPIELRDSHMMTGLAIANCLIEMPEATMSYEEGDFVRIHALHWSLFR